MRQRVGAAGQNQIGAAVLDIAVGGIDRLHPGAAVDLHREGGRGFAQAEPEGGNAGRVRLFGDDVDATQDRHVEGIGGEGLAQQQGPAALDREIYRGEGAGPAACPEEGRARAVDDVDRPAGLPPRLTRALWWLFGHGAPFASRFPSFASRVGSIEGRFARRVNRPGSACWARVGP